MTTEQFFTAATLGCLMFFAVISFSKKSSTPVGYRFLGILFVILAIVFADILLETENIYYKYGYLSIITQPILFAAAPIIYLSVLFLTAPINRILHKTILHLIPYFIVLILYLSQELITKKQAHDSILGSDEKIFENILYVLFFVQMGIYLFLALKQLKNHRIILPNFVADIDSNDFHWLNNTIFGFTIISLFSLLELIFGVHHFPVIFSFCYFLVFFYLGIQLVQQQDVHFKYSFHYKSSIAEINQIEAINNIETKIENIEKKKILTEENLVVYKQKLLEIMNEQRPYLDTEITLAKMGKLLGLNTYQTSFLINNSFNENFYSLINRYRIEECKIALSNYKFNNLPLMTIGFQSGFNSKTVFNTTFKKATGITPKEFREQKTR